MVPDSTLISRPGIARISLWRVSGRIGVSTFRPAYRCLWPQTLCHGAFKGQPGTIGIITKHQLSRRIPDLKAGSMPLQSLRSLGSTSMPLSWERRRTVVGV